VEGFVEVGNPAVIEAPFALFDEQVEMLFGDAVIGPKVALGLAPEVLYAVDVVGRFSKQFRVIDAVVAELRNVENILSGLTFCLMMGRSVCVEAFGMMTTWTFPLRFSSPNTATLPAAPRPRLPFRRPPK